MSKVGYKLPGAFSEAQLERIVSEGICILDKIGIECKHDGIQKALSKRKGIRVRNNRLFFSPQICEEEIGKIRSRNEVLGTDRKTSRSEEELGNIKLVPKGPWVCTNFFDIERNSIRPGTLKDMVAGVKLMESMGIVRKFSSPVLPSDVPPKFQCMAMCKESWKYSNVTGGGVISTVKEVKYLYEMGQIAKVEPPYVMLEFGISPLTFNTGLLDIFYQLLNREELCALYVFAGSIPTLGGTAPIFIPGILAQSVAENLAGALLVELLTEEKHPIGWHQPTDIGIAPIGIDMRYAAVNFSSPESILLLELGKEVAAYLTDKLSTLSAMRTIAKAPDTQAACEKTTCALVGALRGGRHFIDLGQLSIDEIFSPEQMVIDREILYSVERLINGFEFQDTENLTFNTIKEVLDERNFLTHPTTIEQFKNMYWFPQIFERRMLGAWKRAGEPSVIRKAHNIVQERIRTQEPRLDKLTMDELDKIYDKACKSE